MPPSTTGEISRSEIKGAVPGVVRTAPPYGAERSRRARWRALRQARFGQSLMFRTPVASTRRSDQQNAASVSPVHGSLVVLSQLPESVGRI
jgi:hypothetical protein